MPPGAVPQYRCLQNKHPFLLEPIECRSATTRGVFSSTKNAAPPRAPPVHNVERLPRRCHDSSGRLFCKNRSTQSLSTLCSGVRGDVAFSKPDGSPGALRFSEPPSLRPGEWAFILQAPEEVIVFWEFPAGARGEEGWFLTRPLFATGLRASFFKRPCAPAARPG